MHRYLLVAMLMACLLPGCDREQATRAPDGSDSDIAALPRPEANGGSVTGFDGDAPAPPPPTSADSVAQDPGMPAADMATPGTPTTGDDGSTAGFDLASPPATGADARVPQAAVPPAPVQPASPEPSAAEAASVVRSYYGSINAGQYPSAYALWSDGGRASGQTAQQFAGGFSGTSRVTVSTGEPGRVEGAAGSRYVTVPVAVEAIQDDGSIRHYDGTYTLRRAVVDGATPEQRQWRISDADLRQVE